MAKKSLDEIFGDAKNDKKSLDQIFGAKKNAGDSLPEDTAPIEAPKQDILSTIMSFLTPAAEKISRVSGVGAAMGGKDQKALEQSNAQLQKQIVLLQTRAKTETDPEKKRVLLQAARDASARGGQVMSDVIGSQVDQANLSEQDLAGSSMDFAKKYAPAAGVEVASVANSGMTPAGQGAKGLTGVGQRIANQAVTGTVEGGLIGATNPEAENITDRMNKAVTGGVVGGGTGGVLQTGAEIGKGVLKLAKKVVVPSGSAVDLWKSNYTLPSAVEKKIDSDRSTKNAIRWGFQGTIDQIQQKVDSARQPLIRFRDRLLETVEDNIDVSGAQKAAEDFLTGTGISDLDTKQKKVVLQTIRNITSGGEQTITGGTNASRAFNAVTSLEDIGWEKINKSTDNLGAITNHTKYTEGEAYLEAAKFIKSQIDRSTKKNPELAKKALDPETIQQIAAISPELAADVQKATSLSEIRKIMSTFVDLDTMYNSTKKSSNSPLVKAITNGVPAGGVQLNNPGTYLNPIIQRPEFRSGAAVAAGQVPEGLKSLMSMLGSAAGTAGGAAENVAIRGATIGSARGATK